MNGGLSPDIALLAPADKKETPLLQIIHDEALMRIWDWQEWKASPGSGPGRRVHRLLNQHGDRSR